MPRFPSLTAKLPVLLIVGGLGSTSAVAQSPCTHTPLTFCGGCNLSQDWFTLPGRVCTTSTYFANGVISLRVTQKARQGVALVSSNSWGYRAQPSFKGTDEFGIEIKFRDRLGNPQTTRIAVHVKPAR